MPEQARQQSKPPEMVILGSYSTMLGCTTCSALRLVWWLLSVFWSSSPQTNQTAQKSHREMTHTGPTRDTEHILATSVRKNYKALQSVFPAAKDIAQTSNKHPRNFQQGCSTFQSQKRRQHLSSSNFLELPATRSAATPWFAAEPQNCINVNRAARPCEAAWPIH